MLVNDLGSELSLGILSEDRCILMSVYIQTVYTHTRHINTYHTLNTKNYSGKENLLS